MCVEKSAADGLKVLAVLVVLVYIAITSVITLIFFTDGYIKPTIIMEHCMKYGEYMFGQNVMKCSVIPKTELKPK